jgi:hypothetical protein
MPKVIVEFMDGADLIRSKIKADSFFHFVLTIEDNVASLKLLEKMHYQSNKDFDSGVYSNINEYILDEVKIPDKDFDRNAIYQKYNISMDNEGDALSIFDMDELSLALYYNIIEKLKINYLVKNQLLIKEKELEAAEADYFESVLGILGEFGEFGEKVVTSTKSDLAEKYNFLLITRPFFQHAVNEVLDGYIDMFIQELTNEDRERFLIKLREAKSVYYQQFKSLVAIDIVEKAGVRFDSSQVVEEGIIGSLVKEEVTKGYTSSDVRKIVINEDELQLSIHQIKENVAEIEEVCKQNNANGKDIVTNRNLTKSFYDDVEKKYRANMLKPTTLIVEATEKHKEENKKAETSASVSDDKSAEVSAGGGGKSVGGKSAGGGSKGKSDKRDKSNNKKEAAKKQPEKTKSAGGASAGGSSGGDSGGGTSSNNKEKEGQVTVERIEKTEEYETDFGNDMAFIRAGDEVRQGISKSQKGVEVLDNSTNMFMR